MVCSDVQIVGLPRTAVGLSPAWVLLGVRNGSFVIVKVEQPRDTGLKYEREYYRILVPLLRRHTPHLITTVRPQCEIKDFGAVIKPSSRAHQQWLKKKMPRTVNLLFLERALGKSLQDIISSERPSWSRAAQRLFDRDVAIEVAQAFAVFAKYRFMHQDAHMGNVFCELLPEPRKMTYQVQGKPFLTKAMVHLFDLDRSTVDASVVTKLGVGVNQSLSPHSYLCRRWGQCQRFVPKWDWYFWLQRFAFAAKQTGHETILLEWNNLTLQSTQQEKHFLSYPCMCGNPQCKTCVLDAKRMAQMKSPQEFLDSVPF